MLISNIAALLPLAAMWLVFRKCFAPVRVLLYAEIDRTKPFANGDYLQVKSKRYAASPKY